MFKYLEHQADMIIYAQGRSWPEVFNQGARALFNLMYETKISAKGGPASGGKSQSASAPRFRFGPLRRSFPPRLGEAGSEASEAGWRTKVKSVGIKASADSIEALFVEWLNALLAEKDIKELVFFEFKIKKLKKIKDQFELAGSASGIDLSEYQGKFKTEVKAATYGQLKCGQFKDKYYCQCVVDV